MFLKAAQKVYEKIENVAFVLAGEGELIEPLQSFAADLNIGNNVFFIGSCAKVGELLSISDVGVLSSKSEGFSNSILEYMSAAKPVVATNVGGASEAIVEGETGFLVESDDDRAMANRLIELLRNPEKAVEMGKKGRMIVEKSFSLEAQTEKTLTLYKTLLTKKYNT
jgi:glycosyltransferase involved in cell wall biosynthesis